MLRWIVICFLAFGIAKWSGSVHADDELDEEEKQLLRAFESVLNEEKEAAKRDVSVCELDECLTDSQCFMYCCVAENCDSLEQDEENQCIQYCYDAFTQEKREVDCDMECSGSDNPDQCKDDCEENNLLKRRMDLAALSQEDEDQDLKNVQKKWVRVPRIPTPRIPTPRIPRINWPRIPTPRIPTPRIPRINWPRIPTPRIPIPRIPTPRIPTPRIPRIRWSWTGKK